MLEFSVIKLGILAKGDNVDYFATVVIEHTKNDRKYIVALPVGVPYEEAHAALLEIASGVLEIKKQQDEIAAQQASNPVDVE